MPFGPAGCTIVAMTTTDHAPDYAAFTKETLREEHLDHAPPYTYVTLEK